LLIGAAVIASFASFYLSQQGSFRRQRIEVELSQQLRTALDQMVRDLRIAGLDPTRGPSGGGAGAGLVVADVDRVGFSMNNNNDGDTADADEQKGFRRVGSEMRNCTDAAVTSCTEVLATFIATTGTIFRYFRADGIELTAVPLSAADRVNVRRIRISLSASRTLSGGPTISRTEAASASLRNMPS
jgi:hypothetical protein